MARRTEDRDAERQAEIAFFKWEFLRRNSGYQDDFRQVMRQHGAALRRARYPQAGYAASLNERARKDIGTSHFLWRVNFMKDPARKIPLDAMRRRPNSRKQNPFWDAHGFAILSDTVVVNPKEGPGDTVRFKNLSVDFRWESDWFPLAVNLEARPETLQRELMSLLRKVRNERRRQSDEASIRLEARSFEFYLKAWDLKQTGLGDQDIALELGRVERRVDIDESHLLLVRRAIRQAKKLIAGDYRRIS